jgi:hypothetical protein
VKEYEVNCVNKAHPGSSHQHITHIGHVLHGWRLTVESAIERIESTSAAFYTLDRETGMRTYIGVYREQGKAPLLRTHTEGRWNNNLLAQSECGAGCRTI